MSIKNVDLSAVGKQFNKGFLQKKDILQNPFSQFQKWYEEAANYDHREANIVTLATASLAGRPSARTVLLKAFGEDGFIFYTNYNSQKGKELLANPQAALLFYWYDLERQIRIEGKVEKVSKAISDAYFQRRPIGSQIGAVASPQSSVITSRKILEDKVNALKELHQGKTAIERPENWGGFRIIPDRFEFWQGRVSRLHDRIVFCLNDDGKWVVERLAP
ncbi:MAG: pyridoxamine 5'-phosphate oxidase [Chitinophagales bacterium]